MKSKLILSAILILALLLILPIASMSRAVYATPGGNDNGNGTFVNESGVPKGSKLVSNFNFNVTNDEDSGFYSYWALDNYNKQVQIWQVSAGNYYVVVKYSGTFTTFAGALSPQNHYAEGSTQTGTFSGGYTAVITGDPSAPLPPKGTYLGSYDFGGTPSDVLVNSYGTQTGDTSVFDWVGTYFSGATFSFTDNSCSGGDWSWKYVLGSQTWINSGCGSSGDIVTGPSSDVSNAPLVTPNTLCNSYLPDLSSASQVIGVTWSVINSEDASMGPWYWALDYFQVGLTVWQQPDGSYVALKTYDGYFYLPSGSHSPNGGLSESNPGSGTFDACYIATFSATLNPNKFANGNPLSSSGYLGIENDGGTISDVLASYPSGSLSANPGYWSWYGAYFTGTNTFSYLYDTWHYSLTTNMNPTQGYNNLIETGIYSSNSPTVTGDIVTS